MEVKVSGRWFYLWRGGKRRVYCVELLSDGTDVRIDFFDQLSPDVIPKLKEAVDILLPDIVHGPTIDPTEHGGFRFYHNGGCGGPCPEFAS